MPINRLPHEAAIEEGVAMSHTIAHVAHVEAPAMPRGAALVGMLYSAVSGLFHHTPARPASRAEEAAAVYEMARQLQGTDPSFAADLFAAAARHESIDE
jgi:hypothetical protein